MRLRSLLTVICVAIAMTFTPDAIAQESAEKIEKQVFEADSTKDHATQTSEETQETIARVRAKAEADKSKERVAKTQARQSAKRLHEQEKKPRKLRVMSEGADLNNTVLYKLNDNIFGIVVFLLYIASWNSQ